MNTTIFNLTFQPSRQVSTSGFKFDSNCLCRFYNFLLENCIKKKLHSFLGLFFERSTYTEPILEMNTKIKTLHVLIELVSEAFLVDKVFYAGTKIKQEIYLSGKLHSGYFRENSDSSQYTGLFDSNKFAEIVI